MDVSKIMSENIDMILNRGQNLGKISKMSNDLKDESSKVFNIIIHLHYYYSLRKMLKS